MKNKVKSKWFDNYSDLLHYTASNDYKNNVDYRYSGLVFRSNKMYYNGVLKGIVDRKKERILLLKEGSGTWEYIIYTTKEAFEYYYIACVNDFDINKQKLMVDVLYKRLKDRKKYIGHTNYRNLKHLYDSYIEFCGYKSVAHDKELSNKVSLFLAEQDVKRSHAEEEQHKQYEESKRQRDITDRYAIGVIKTFLNGLDKDLPVGLAIKELKSTRFYDSKLENSSYFTKDRDFNAPEDKQYYYRTCWWRESDIDNLIADLYNVKKVHRSIWSTEYSLPDFVWYDATIDSFVTSQNVKVENCDSLTNMIRLFDKALKSGKELDKLQEHVNKHVGSYDIRQINIDDWYIRVGCHVFSLDCISELVKEIDGNVKVANQYRLNKLIKEMKATEEHIKSLQEKVERYKNMINKMKGV